MRNRVGKTVMVLGKSFRAWDQWVEEEVEGTKRGTARKSPRCV